MMSSAEWDRRHGVSELVWTAEPNRFVAAELADLVPGRALDLGCGEGRNAVWLAEQGWRVTGVDFSRVALEKARRLADGGVGGPQDPGVLYTPEEVVAELGGLRIGRAERVRRPVGEGTAVDTLVRTTRYPGG